MRIKQSGRARDTPDDERPAFVVQDGNYLSARWPGDVHTLARRFASVLEQSVPDGPIRRGEEPIPS